MLNDMWDKIQRRLARISEVKGRTLDYGPGAVSFTFDDVPISGCREGSHILEKHERRGTFYVCGGLTDSGGDSDPFHRLEDLQGLIARGHEVCCHGYDHLNYQSVSLPTATADLDRNKHFLRELGLGEEPRHFAYPYGCVKPAVKAMCGRRFVSSRGVQRGINGAKTDLALLKSVPLYAQRESEESIKGLLEETLRQRGWLIFFTHRVTPDPGEFDCTPELLAFGVSTALELGCNVAPVGRVLEGIS